MFYAFYKQNGQLSSITGKNEILPHYIVNYLQPGVVGFIIASIFAAAISTLSSSLSAMASASIFDFKSGGSINKARMMIVIWGLTLAIVAFFVQVADENVLTLGLGIASILYGGILSVFITAKLGWKLGDKEFLYSLLSGVLTVFFLWIYQVSSGHIILAWTFFIPLGLIISLSTARMLKE